MCEQIELKAEIHVDQDENDIPLTDAGQASLDEQDKPVKPATEDKHDPAAVSPETIETERKVKVDTTDVKEVEVCDKKTEQSDVMQSVKQEAHDKEESKDETQKDKDSEGDQSKQDDQPQETMEKKGSSEDKDKDTETTTMDKLPDDAENVVQQQPTSMAAETTSERVAPVCQLARAQAPVQAFMRPSMWLPGVKKLHMAGETWLLKETPDECLARFLNAVDNVPQEELMEVRKLDRVRHYVEVFSFTKGCNWLDVVEVTFHEGEEPDTTKAEIVSFSSGLFPAWLPLSFVCNCLCFYAPFSGNGQNTRRLELLRNGMLIDVTITSETKCNCLPS